jgi:acyl-CoA synthetase (AMP-forming)/AMP-acid ligase II
LAADRALHDGSIPAFHGFPMHPTSGTTGLPKLALRPGRAALAEAGNYRDTLDVSASDVLLCLVPMSHAYGFGTCAMLPLVSGARVVASRRFNPHAAWRAMREHSVTIFPGVPAMLHLLLVAGSRNRDGVPRRVLSAGSPLPEQTRSAFREGTGRAVCALYGTTETGGISVDVDPGPDSPAGCVGPAMQTVSAEVRAVADSAEWPQGIGRVWIQSPSMMAGYLSPAGIDSPLVDGWFQTGDLGRTDEDGRIELVGRESEVINVFGMKVIPSEIEDVIAGLAGISEVKVYAGRHGSGSQFVKAVVCGPAALDLAAVRDHCVRNLAPYKRPTVIDRLDALPRTPTGKIIRDQLP